MENQNLQKIKELEEVYNEKLDMIQREFNSSKKTADGLKIIYEEKLTQQEEEHEQEIGEQKDDYQTKIDQLNEMISTLQNKHDEIK